METKKLILDGLSCAACADRIEKKIEKLDGVAGASVNFAAKTLIINAADGSDIRKIFDESDRIIRSIEPDIIITEKSGRSFPGKKVLSLNGLHCEYCAAKMEKEIRNIHGVEGANIDFGLKILTVSAKNRHDLQRIMEEASAVAEQVNPGIKFLEKDTAGAAAAGGTVAVSKVIRDAGTGIKAVHITLLRLIVSFVLLLAAIFAALPPAIELSLFLSAYLLSGGDVLFKAARNLVKGRLFDEHFLMSIATIGAFLIREYPEGAAVMIFYQAGDLLSNLAVNRSRRSISELMDLRPEYANLKKTSAENEDIIQVPPEEVKIGDIIIVKPGEKIPLDAEIIEGSSSINTSALTGESIPKDVAPGDGVMSGTININGLLTARVIKEYGESTVTKILELVQDAGSRKARTESYITRFARYYTPVVVSLAAALAFIPPLVLPGASFSDWFYRALVFLVISCPCALVLSIPLGFFGGIGGASRNGILIKGGNYLEALNNIGTVVFDKTGTLTKGVFKVTGIENANPALPSPDILELAAYAEAYSTHPIAKSIVEAYNERYAGRRIDKDLIEDYSEISGQGIKVKVNGREILAGNAGLLRNDNISFAEPDETGTIVHIAADGRYAGYVVISDEIKEDSAEAVRQLRQLGVKRLVMLTGDSKAAAEKVSLRLGMDETYSELLPHQKVEILEKLQKKLQDDSGMTTGKTNRNKVAYVGDGINDAPVLTRADMGIAMGGLGSDAAIEAADIVIMTDELTKIPAAICIARKTINIVRQNIIFTFLVKGIILILGAGGLASMWEAVFADVGVAVLAVFNSMRVLNNKDIT